MKWYQKQVSETGGIWLPCDAMGTCYSDWHWPLPGSEQELDGMIDQEVRKKEL